MNRRRYPSKISGKKAEAQLSMLLSGCTDEKLAGFTAASLAAAWNVKLPKAEQMLAAARQGRLV